jgi:hypothetical protein
VKASLDVRARHAREVAPVQGGVRHVVVADHDVLQLVLPVDVVGADRPDECAPDEVPFDSDVLRGGDAVPGAPGVDEVLFPVTTLSVITT